MIDAPSVLDSRAYPDGYVIQADCLRWMQEAAPDDTFGAIAADFPFNAQDGRTDYGAFVADVARECFRVLVDGGSLIALNNPHATLRTSSAFLDSGFDVRNGIALLRPGSFAPPQHLAFSHNYAMLLVKGDKKLKWHEPDEPVLDSMGYQNGKRRGRLWHPQAVPVEFWEEMLPLVTDPDDTVLDIFAGSGSIIPAARALGLRWVAVDVARSSFVMCETTAEAGTQDALFP